MPRILELKQIDGAMWAKLDIDTSGGAAPVGLYTYEEEMEIRRSERNSALEEAAEAALALRKFKS